MKPKSQDTLSNTDTMISFIIPAMNEEKTIKTLFNGIQEEVGKLTDLWEIIFIDDGSSDQTWNEMSKLQRRHPSRVRTFQFLASSKR